MFQNPVRGLTIFRSAIVVNAVAILSLVFYITNVTFFRLLCDNIHDEGEATAEVEHNQNTPWTQFFYALGFTIIIVMITVQLTMDIDMLIMRSDYEDTDEERIKRAKIWFKMSIGFLSICILLFTASLFFQNTTTSPAKISPILILFFGYGGLLFRFGLLFIGRKYIAYLVERRDLTRHRPEPIEDTRT